MLQSICTAQQSVLCMSEGRDRKWSNNEIVEWSTFQGMHPQPISNQHSIIHQYRFYTALRHLLDLLTFTIVQCSFLLGSIETIVHPAKQFQKEGEVHDRRTTV